jgi:hypothetical protein
MSNKWIHSPVLVHDHPTDREDMTMNSVVDSE